MLEGRPFPARMGLFKALRDNFPPPRGIRRSVRSGCGRAGRAFDQTPFPIAGATALQPPDGPCCLRAGAPPLIAQKTGDC